MKLVLNRSNKNKIIEWQERIQNEDSEEIYETLKELNPFTKDNVKADEDSSDLASFLEAFYNFIVTSSENERNVIKGLCNHVFKFSDLILLAIQGLNSRISKSLSESAKWNLYWFMRFIPLPTKKLYPLYRDDYEVLPIGSNILNEHVQSMWLSFTKLELPSKLCRLMVPFFVEHIIDALPNSELFGDFLFSVFNKGQIYSVLSLAGIFKLIVHRNFEYPEFYSQVYHLTHSSVCYSSYSQKFFELLDLFLSSTHIPSYILAAFVKKLSRILLQAPLSHQFVLLTLIRNLITRHNVLLPLIHRDEPAVYIDPYKTLVTFTSDPYNEEEKNPKNSKALESSLWELTLVRKHWYDRVSKKADFLDRQAQEQENLLIWKSVDELFEEIMARKFGAGTAESTNGNDQEVFYLFYTG
uniref:CCAAT-binding factor domain-containing protein n=1 Tax=Acrobeloides nanus TaxID=290746 RepID=A0A914CZH5_9BILA